MHTPANTTAEVPIPPHSYVEIPWRQAGKAGTREDRTLHTITASLPPYIAELSPTIPSQLNPLLEEAIRSIAKLDSEHGEHLHVLSALLLRAESVASSKIEHLDATTEDYARATHGIKSNESATAMVSASKAISNFVGVDYSTNNLSIDHLLDAHCILMATDPMEQRYAGRIRDMQNWIGGSDYSPRGALYVPPPPSEVERYLDDLFTFANRTDIPAIVQAAIAHAQFESIHPFTDGNGRIGRALINAILRKRGVTTRVVVPLASSLVAQRDTYFNTLSRYRAGDAAPLIHAVARGSIIAAHEASHTATFLAGLHEQWIAQYSTAMGRAPRTGSMARKIIDQLSAEPFFTAEDIELTIGGATSSVHAAIGNLEQAGIIRGLTQRVRNQVWAAHDILAELDDLGVRIARATLA